MTSSAIETRLGRFYPAALALFRGVLGLLMSVHGTEKLFAWPNAVHGVPGPAVPAGTWPYWYAGVIELAVGLLVLTGLFTRLAAFIGSGTMAFAYFTDHQPNALWPNDNGGELAVLYCFGFFLLVFAGAGAVALDNVLRRR